MVGTIFRTGASTLSPCVVKCLFFLSAKDQLSIIRVCRHIRNHAIADPSLWTWVDQIDHPTALSFVLESAKDSAVDITDLHVSSQNDDLLQVVRSHMHHVRRLDVYVDTTFTAHAAFTTPAPMLERLSFHNTGSNVVYMAIRLDSSNYPRLSCVQLNAIQLNGTVLSNFQAIQTLRTFSYRDVGSPDVTILADISNKLPKITTVNLELASWGAVLGSATLAPAIRRVNIRWTKPGLFIPFQAMPNHDAWSTARKIHISHTDDSPCGPSQNYPDGETFPMLAQIRLDESTHSAALAEDDQRVTFYNFFESLWVRTSITSGRHVHVRVVHKDGRERVFCGLHLTTVSGVAARIPGLQLTTLTVATTAVAFHVLSHSKWPALHRIHLVSDTCDTTWISIFGQDISNTPNLTHLDLSIERDVEASWSSTTITRVLGCCIAAGHNLQQVSFLGFGPDTHCTKQAEVLAKKIVVDRNWHELESERTWFTKPAFEW